VANVYVAMVKPDNDVNPAEILRGLFEPGHVAFFNLAPNAFGMWKRVTRHCELFDLVLTHFAGQHVCE